MRDGGAGSLYVGGQVSAAPPLKVLRHTLQLPPPRPRRCGHWPHLPRVEEFGQGLGGHSVAGLARAEPDVACAQPAGANVSGDGLGMALPTNAGSAGIFGADRGI